MCGKIMKIICKIKDYYDYIQEGEDIVFDRRKSWCATPDTEKVDSFSNYTIINEILHYKETTSKVIGLFIGYHLYVFLLTTEGNRTKLINTQEYVQKFKYNVKLITYVVNYKLKHKLPMEFVEVSTSYIDKFYSWRNWGKYVQEDNEFLIKELQKNNVNLWKISPLLKWKHEADFPNLIPILKNTFVPKFVPPEIVYRAVEEWLIAKHNDVNQESKGLTDVDKAVNHGFDKKYSFRSTK